MRQSTAGRLVTGRTAPTRSCLGTTRMRRLWPQDVHFFGGSARGPPNP